jgi:ABC-type glycerol-3-phosphate transport system substrate-binding protein
MTTHRTSHRLPPLLAPMVLLTTVVGGGALAASAATPATRSATPAHSAVVLNYWDMQWGGPTFTNQTKANVAAFNRTHPGIYVKYQQLSWGDYT